MPAETYNDRPFPKPLPKGWWRKGTRVTTPDLERANVVLLVYGVGARDTEELNAAIARTKRRLGL